MVCWDWIILFVDNTDCRDWINHLPTAESYHIWQCGISVLYRILTPRIARLK